MTHRRSRSADPVMPPGVGFLAGPGVVGIPVGLGSEFLDGRRLPVRPPDVAATLHVAERDSTVGAHGPNGIPTERSCRHHGADTEDNPTRIPSHAPHHERILLCAGPSKFDDAGQPWTSQVPPLWRGPSCGHGAPSLVELARRRERARSSQWTTTWASNLAAARQYAEREGHLDVPRSHVETIDGTAHTLGIFIANQRPRARCRTHRTRHALGLSNSTQPRQCRGRRLRLLCRQIPGRRPPNTARS
ncbi:helicase associated domain-containing protein [Actinacidiphila glaucinigra]|uniref:helicase associated domain-containing protein n=1 Tax=Actinacidiphila glaucinigra TaxID=235986 RepID=UPI00366BBF6E